MFFTWIVHPHTWQLKISKSYRKNGPNRLNWQCFLAGSSMKAPRVLIFFNCRECQTFILDDIHCHLSALISWHNNSFLSGVCWCTTKKDWDISAYFVHISLLHISLCFEIIFCLGKFRNKCRFANWVYKSRRKWNPLSFWTFGVGTVAWNLDMLIVQPSLPWYWYQFYIQLVYKLQF